VIVIGHNSNKNQILCGSKHLLPFNRLLSRDFIPESGILTGIGRKISRPLTRSQPPGIY
jgi:hypothetical protein